ncbi:MAG: exopolysaccharide biosynthesis polyprenyl glycosylphosphotransferase [Verrucomicrobiaceae bacterium]|nr:exopolysaccharide biosynthesis polyprenyl glycosylphosphotransferase [Verrucomicrobiaceae bacterium]
MAATTFIASNLLESDSPKHLKCHHYGTHRWVIMSAIGDFLMAFLGASIAFWVRFEVLDEVGFFKAQDVSEYFVHLTLGSVALVGVLAYGGIYHREMLLHTRKIIRRMIKGVIFWTAGFLLVALAFHIGPPISRIYMALNGLITLPLILIWRRAFDSYLRTPARLAALQQRTIVVGTREDAIDLKAKMDAHSEDAVKVIGWVSTSESSAHAKLGNDLPRLGDVQDMEDVLTRHPADVVVLADLSGPRKQALDVANLCEREMIGFKIIPSCFAVFQSGLKIETVGGSSMLGVSRLPLDNSFNVYAKRMVDIVGGTIGLLLSLPLIIIFGGLVYMESRGPIFYRQRRTGANGRAFHIIKIRSMRLDAEKNGAQWCKEDDPRRLKVGEFMRKWNIDEVPQFWNVIKGEMSLVGPRPERPELIAGFKHQIPHYNARHQAKPGMTGWAQVQGLRGDTSLTDRIKADLWYLENWSLLLDIQIMILTFFKRANAY